MALGCHSLESTDAVRLMIPMNNELIVCLCLARACALFLSRARAVRALSFCLFSLCLFLSDSVRAGETWSRAPPGPDGRRPAVLPRGLSPQAATASKLDGMMIFTPNSPIVEGAEVKLFYEGCSNSHAAAVDDCGAPH